MNLRCTEYLKLLCKKCSPRSFSPWISADELIVIAVVPCATDLPLKLKNYFKQT